jgi:divalent metal cation (Fe/Co/Zn/Cd) transporter
VALIGILLAQLTGILYFDGAASVLIGVILGVTAAWPAYATKGLLIGEGAGLEVVNGIREIARATPGVHLRQRSIDYVHGP